MDKIPQRKYLFEKNIPKQNLKNPSRLIHNVQKYNLKCIKMNNEQCGKFTVLNLENNEQDSYK